MSPGHHIAAQSGSALGGGTAASSSSAFLPIATDLELRHTAVKAALHDGSVNQTSIDSHGLRSLRATTDSTGRVLRPARALLGWMHSDDAQRVLVSNRGDVQPSAEQVRVVETAHQFVRNRHAFGSQPALERDVPPDLVLHLERLQKNPAAMAYFLEGWRVRLVDLTHLVAFQPAVFVDSAMERVQGIESGDLPALAEICLPIPSGKETLSPTLDKVKNVWTILSSNPNLRVVGQFAGPLQGGPGGSLLFGFFVALAPSFVQVAHFQGRYVLRDGYHRALGLLASGITEIPAFVRDFDAIEQMVPPGMLPQAAWLGSTPPMLADYLDNEVAATVQLPAVQKVVMVQGVEATASA